ncbi:ABC1 family-domain-containing protein [Lipomyces japonicus]|uniref:ABC1 family-domain-containing protein n=1 Tax=Lipomyces japonicus TaxID=56871 RepID=UPI0034CFE911
MTSCLFRTRPLRIFNNRLTLFDRSGLHRRPRLQLQLRHLQLKNYSINWHKKNWHLIGFFFLPAAIKCDFPSLDQIQSHPADYQTREQYLLSISDKQQHEHEHEHELLIVSKFENQGSIWVKVYGALKWLHGILANSGRFVHLAVVFLPVIAAAPVVLVGTRQSGKDNERTGALFWYRLLVYSMELAGPTFIKLGQWAASRTDIFPKMMCIELSKLHSSVKAHSLEYTKRTIEQAFPGLKFDEIFEEFVEQPLGIGAIAQVYKAKLGSSLVENLPLEKIGNKWVAVKVLHPRVETHVHRDLAIMIFFAKLIDLIPTIEWLSLPNEVEQFGNMMRLQMDLRIESANLSIFEHNFKDRDGIHFPVSYSALIPNMNCQRVLIEEFVPAIPINKLLQLPAHNRVMLEQQVADMGLNAFLNMLLIDNFVHADLHPGNIMVRFVKTHNLRDGIVAKTQKKLLFWGKDDVFDVADTNEITNRLISITDSQQFRAELASLQKHGYKPQVVFLDAGLVTELNDLNRRNFLDLFTAIALFDGYRAGQLMVERSTTPRSVVDPEVFALRMQHLVLAVKSKTLALGKIKLSDILNQVLGMVRTHHVRMEGDFINVVISILLLEGIGRQLDPGLDILSSSLPILRKLGSIQGQHFLTTSTSATATSTTKTTSTDSLSGNLSDMLKIWVALEAREFVTASASDIKRLVMYDRLCPNM